MARDPGTGARRGSVYSRYRRKPPPLDADPVVGFDPALGVSVTKSGKSLDVRGRRSPTRTPLQLLDDASQLALGVKASETNVAKLARGERPNLGGPMIFPGFGLVKARGGRSGGGKAALDALRPKPEPKPYRPRTLTAGELEQQLPKARSRITQTLIEKPADVASRTLERSERAKRTPLVRLGTASERVAKAAGRSQRIERGRREAAVSLHLNAIKHVKPGSPHDVANFWYAQLPATHRNAAGLDLVRGKQADELAYITSGAALRDLDAWETSVNARLREAKDPGEAGRLLREREEVKVLKADLPQRIDDIGASIGELEKLIRKPPRPLPAAIDAARALGASRERILVDAGRLNPEKAEPRRGLVARWVGLEPTGDEAYIGHRLPRPQSFAGSFAPSGGTGRPRSPKGVGTENKLVLAKTGRLRPSLRVAAEDWQSAQVFEQANVARNDLGRLGRTFTGHVPADHVLVNPKGRTVPPHWRNDELAQFAEGYDDVEQIRRQAREIVGGFVAETPDEFEAMKQAALDSGVSWDELRVVPKRLVDRYYAQFRPAAGRRTAGKAYDSLVDVVATSIVFARLGYIPKNIVQNVIMAAPHQGPLLLVNAVRAGQAMADPQLRALLRAEVGFTGATGALGREAASQKLLGAAAGAVGKIADDPIRISAFLHEAAAAGVISRVSPLLTRRDRAALLKLLTDKQQRPLLNDIRSRGVEAMADFSRMTPDQARIARRILIIPGWLMAGSRYPFHFAATHPVRSALLAYIAMGEPFAPERLQFNKPVNRYLTGDSYRRGIDTPAGRIRTGSLTPVGTPAEIAGAAVQTLRGKNGPYDFTHDTVFDFAQPLAAAGIRFAQGEGAARSFTPLAPNLRLIQALLSPEATPTYPEDASRLGRLKRELGVLPVAVNDRRPKAPQLPTPKRGGSVYSRFGGRSGGSVYTRTP